jgi:filamentous hemagglutinin
MSTILPIHEGQQGKHIPGHPNYQPGRKRSILTHEDPPGLVIKFAGTGEPANNYAPGTPGYRERVDFGEPIGFFINRKTGKSFPTTKGIIHYSKKGVHIVPASP